MVAAPEELTGRPMLRLNIVGLVVLVLFVVLVLRLWALQVIDHSSYSAAVNANEVRTAGMPRSTGLITGRTGAVLAGNQVQYQIVLARLEAAQDPSIIGKVAALVGETPAQVQTALTNPQYSPYEPVPILTGAPTATVQYLSEHRTEFPGVSLQQVTERTYPQGGTTAAQVIGYVSPINATELKTGPAATTPRPHSTGSRGSRTSTSPTWPACPGPGACWSTPRARWSGHCTPPRPPRATPW